MKNLILSAIMMAFIFTSCDSQTGKTETSTSERDWVCIRIPMPALCTLKLQVLKATNVQNAEWN